ncbi:MAG: four-carbon acid sugar kinase family protein [Candidatus Bathyarchaeia archaeon]
MKYGVIADDFTGAGDVSLQFRRNGFKTTIITKFNRFLVSNVIKHADVTIFDTETRNSSSNEAYKTVKEVAAIIKDIGIELVYKKIDSTMRGNIGAELDAILDESIKNFSIVAPALPEAQRATIGGYHFVKWRLIEQTEFAKDPLKPVKESSLMKIISSQSKRIVAHIPLTYVVKGLEALRHEVNAKLKEGAEIIVVDAITQEDLQTVAQACKVLNALPCGSSGLAENVAEFLEGFEKRSLAIFSSSINPTFMKQVEEVKKHNVTLIELNTSKLFKRRLMEAELKSIETQINEALRRKRDVILKLKKFESSINPKLSELIREAITQLVENTIKNGKIKGLILIGGDTAFSVIKKLRASILNVNGEAEFGAPVITIASGKHKGMKLITRPGGFGSKTSLINMIKRFKCELN